MESLGKYSEDLAYYCVMKGRELDVNGYEIYLSNQDELREKFMPPTIRALITFASKMGVLK